MFDMIDGGGKVTAKLKVASAGGLCGIWLILSGSSPTQPLGGHTQLKSLLSAYAASRGQKVTPNNNDAAERTCASA
jgi:hypothetical protein